MDREGLVAEFLTPAVGGDAELDALAIAVAIEDAFDVVLADHEISLETLGSRDAVLQLLERHLGAP